MTERSQRRPLIGITAGVAEMMTGAWAGHRALSLTEHYGEAVRRAGARPVILTQGDDWSAEELAELDGIIFSGGSDIDPALYGASPCDTDLGVSPERDAWELALYQTSRAAGVPILGICRGLQLIVVAEGGGLHQHLPLDVPHHPVVCQKPTAVEVTIAPDSDLALSTQHGSEVLTYHHQGIKSVPPTLRPVASHSSGLILAVEGTSGAPLIAVQWHPELREETRGVVQHFVEVAIAQSSRLRYPRNAEFSPVLG